MRRKRNAGTPPPVAPQPQPQIVTQERAYSLITPLFGGGAVTGERDEVTIIRGTEIRGHLRFWWRACYGGRYSSVDEMKKDEDRIWGAAATSKKGTKDNADAEQKSAGDGQKENGTVQIVVEPISTEKDIKEEPPYEVVQGEQGKNKVKSKYDIPGYAAFPFRPPQEEVNNPVLPVIKPVYSGIRFLLTISFPSEMQKEIQGALWAWETFGGIGTRTRRGFGALHLDKAMLIQKSGDLEKKEEIRYPFPIADEKKVKDWIVDRFKAYGIDKTAPAGVPCLSSTSRFEVLNFRLNVKRTWNKLIDALSSFRQQRSGGQRRQGSFGRSQWPEAEAIRTFTNQRDSDKYQKLPHPHKFPRAALGLPIVFHFKDRRDPEETTLQGPKEGYDRLASPLILRPLQCSDRNAVGLILVLDNFAFPEEKLLLKEMKSKKEHRVSPYLERDEVNKVLPLDGEPDVLQAFLNHVNKSWNGGNR